MEDCPICKSGEVGRTFCRDLILGKKNYVEVAQYFGITPQEVMTHVNTHEIVIDEATGKYESPDFYMNELLKLLKMFKDWLTFTIECGGLDKQKVDIGVKLAREIRLTLESLAEFQGRFDRGGNTTIQIGEINAKYMQLTNVLLMEVCDGCRGKIIKILDDQNNKMLEGTTSNTCEQL